MRRLMWRTSQLAILSALAVAATGCASVSNDAAPNTPSATVAQRNTTSPASPSGGSTGGSTPAPSSKTTSKDAPQPKQKTPFAGLASYVTGTHYYITAAVYDNKTGRTFLLDPSPGVPERTASIVKVEIMGTLFRERQVDHQDLTSSDRSLLAAMIEDSDNDAATSLWNEDGGAPAIQSFDNKIGMTGTVASTLAFIPGSTTLPGWGWTSTTARDQLAVVKDFAYPNRWLSPADRSYGLSLMEDVTADQAWGVSSGPPPGTIVALKNGWLPLDLSNDTNWQVNSIGWIKGHGRDYVLAILCQGSLSEGDGITAVDTISRHVYAALGS
jgi:hypothetical protein